MSASRKAKFTRQLKKAGLTDAEIALALKSATFTNEIGPDMRYIERPDTLAGLMGIPHVPEATAAWLVVDGVNLGDTSKMAAQERYDAALKKTKQSRGGIASGEKRRDPANRGQDVVNTLTAELRRKHPKISRPDLLDKLVAEVADAGLSYTRNTLARMMPPKPRL